MQSRVALFINLVPSWTQIYLLGSYRIGTASEPSSIPSTSR
jgi:hypothetical protein